MPDPVESFYKSLLEPNGGHCWRQDLRGTWEGAFAVSLMMWHEGRDKKDDRKVGESRRGWIAGELTQCRALLRVVVSRVWLPGCTETSVRAA